VRGYSTRGMKLNLILGLICAALVCVAGAAQTPPPTSQATASEAQAKAPALTAEQKAALGAAMLRLENAQLRAQIAARDAADLVRALQQPGYDLNLQTLEYQPKAKDEKPSPKK
jgi:hypothetical protein